MPIFTGNKFGFGLSNEEGGAAAAGGGATFSGSASGGTKTTVGDYTVPGRFLIYSINSLTLTVT